MVNDMKHSNLFSDDQITFEYSVNGLTEQDINNLIPEDFNGKDFFVKFYLTHNGGIFTMIFSDMRGAFYYRDTFYPAKDGYTIGVDQFFYIPGEKCKNSPYIESIDEVWRIMKNHSYSSKVRKFAESHFPFTTDGYDNFCWLDMKSGCIKFIDWEYDDDPDNAFIIAPTFYDFCANLLAKPREGDRDTWE